MKVLVEIAVRKAPIIAPFIERFKVAILKGSHWQVLTVFWVIPLKLTFH